VICKALCIAGVAVAWTWCTAIALMPRAGVAADDAQGERLHAAEKTTGMRSRRPEASFWTPSRAGWNRRGPARGLTRIFHPPFGRPPTQVA